MRAAAEKLPLCEEKRKYRRGPYSGIKQTESSAARFSSALSSPYARDTSKTQIPDSPSPVNCTSPREEATPCVPAQSEISARLRAPFNGLARAAGAVRGTREGKVGQRDDRERTPDDTRRRSHRGMAKPYRRTQESHAAPELVPPDRKGVRNPCSRRISSTGNSQRSSPPLCTTRRSRHSNTVEACKP